MRKRIILILSLCVLQYTYSQNECTKWYFGNKGALDFSTNPPTILYNSAMNAGEGCGSISDNQGNLLFYCKGDSVYNRQHQLMANGFGLGGNEDATQSALIQKQPGSNNLYYIFTQEGFPFTNGFRYSIIDMSLAAGNGSVVVKNQLLHLNSSEKVCAVRHCNNSDVWVISHEGGNNVFRTYLLSSAGVSTLAIVSVIGTNIVASNGAMKVSHQGKKIGLTAGNFVEAFDFNNATGLVSNPLTLTNVNGNYYGCEFSPDDSKFYASVTMAPTNNSLIQWNLCAGSTPAILASQYTISAAQGWNSDMRAIQLAPNGKLYISRPFQTVLGVIHNPNLGGAACNFVELGQSIFPNICRGGLPDFVSSNVKEFVTYTHLSCLTLSFSPPSAANQSLTGCSAPSNSFTGMSWNFGDPASGPANTSALVSPTHTFSSYGTYTIQAVINYAACGSDTIRQFISFNSPTVSVSSASIGCNGLATASVVVAGGSGNYSYTWSPSAQSTSVSNALVPGNYTIAIKDNAYNCTFNYSTSINVPSANISFSTQITPVCNLASATVVVSGGSGNYSYLWSPGNLNTVSVNNVSGGPYTVTVNDITNNCTITNTVNLTTLPLPNLTVSPNTTVCAKQSVTLNVSGANIYFWNNTSTLSSIVVTPSVTSYYSITGTYTNGNCSSSKTITLTVVPCLGIYAYEANSSQLLVYPNPSSGVFELEILSEQNISLYNALGQIILEKKYPAGKHQIDLSGFENGNYFLKAESSSGASCNLKLLKVAK